MTVPESPGTGCVRGSGRHGEDSNFRRPDAQSIMEVHLKNPRIKKTVLISMWMSAANAAIGHARSRVIRFQ